MKESALYLILKYINHPSFFQEWKLNLDDAAYGKYIDNNMSKPFYKKEIYCLDSNLYWPTSIKYTIQ